MARKRLDVMLVEQGLIETRQKAQALIMAGKVRVNDQPAPKAGTRIREDARLQVLGNSHPYVSRGGVKLAGALKTFSVDPSGWIALDIGASTGGFCDVLLRHGAIRIYAIDVGTNQLHWKMRSDERVVCMEGVNARYLDENQLPEKGDGAVIDVSFISLSKILPALLTQLKPGASIVSLVKPQFEAGPGEVGKGGIVRDPEVRARVLETVKNMATALGYTVLAETVSSLPGTHGNIEFFLHLRTPGLSQEQP